MWIDLGWKKCEKSIVFQVKLFERYGFDLGICIFHLQVIKFLIQIGV